MNSHRMTVTVSDTSTVSALLDAPASPRACYVLAHGAGAGMTHAFLAMIADGLVERGIAVLRYQFPYMEQRTRRPDPPKVAHAAVRAAVVEAARQFPGLPIFAGGKSFGGRMTSQAQAAAPLDEVRGLIFLGFPLHPPGKASVERAKHLFDVAVPMLFVQGTRDKLADIALLEAVCRQLRERATLALIADADHSFKVPVRLGRKQPEVFAEILDAIAAWIGARMASQNDSPPAPQTAAEAR